MISGALPMAQEAEVSFVLPPREAVAHFALRSARSTQTEQMGGTDKNGNVREH